MSEFESAEAEIAWLRGEVEFGMTRYVWALDTLSEQAAVHHKREMLLRRSGEVASKHLLNLKAAGAALKIARQERDEARAELEELRRVAVGTVRWCDVGLERMKPSVEFTDAVADCREGEPLYRHAEKSA